MGELRCSNQKCLKKLADVDLKDGRVEIKCKCGTVNAIEVISKNREYVQNQPYQNRMNLVTKGG